MFVFGRGQATATPVQGFVFPKAKPAAAAAYSLTAAAASYAITGQALGITRGIQVAMGAGSYAITGQALGITRGVQIAMAAGSYAITGNDLGVYPSIVMADTGVYTITGYPLTINNGRTVAAAAGTYAITGQALAIRRGFAVLMGAGTYTVSGQAANIVAAKTWYVDNSVGTSGNGLSFATAWKLFTDIVQASIGPGDVIEVSGGASGHTHTELFDFSKSGAAGNRIEIRPSAQAGHNGGVTLDFGSSASNYLYLHDLSYLWFHGFTLKNGISGAVAYLYTLGGDVIFEDCPIYTGPGDTAGNGRGLDVRHCVGTNGLNYVRRITITTPASTTAQTDGIYSQDNDGVFYEDNPVTISNTDSTGHSDCFQSYDDGDITVRRNKFFGAPGGTDNHPVWMSDTKTGKKISFYDNLSVSRNTNYNVTQYRSGAGVGTGYLEAFNNTIVGGARGFNFERNANQVGKNNIIVPDSGGVGVFNTLTALTPGNFDYNLIYAPGGTIANLLGVAKTWAQWQSDGYDAHGVNADPQFIDAAALDYNLLSTSPAKDAGTTLAGVTDDIRGVPRPKGAAYDIGAYEAFGATIDVQAGSYALTGNALAVTFGRRLAAAQGTYAISGQAANLLRGYALTAQAGVYSIVGNDLAITRGYVAAAGSGTYGITGYDIAISLLSARELLASPGSYALTGQDLGIKKGSALVSAAGSYALVGNNLAFQRTYIFGAVAGVYVLTGYDLAVSRLGAFEVAINPGAYVLSGQDLGIRKASVLQAAAGAYALNGQALGILANRTLAAQAGSYAVVGQDAAISYGTRMVAGAGSYSIIGNNLGIGRSRMLALGPGSYVLSGINTAIVYVVNIVHILADEERRLDVPAEDRELTVSAEQRILMPPAQSRILRAA